MMTFTVGEHPQKAAAVGEHPQKDAAVGERKVPRAVLPCNSRWSPAVLRPRPTACSVTFWAEHVRLMAARRRTGP
jgi:hypothetical protein